MSTSPSLFPLTDEIAVQNWLNRTGAHSQETMRAYKMQASRLKAFLAMDTGQWDHPRLVLDATSDQIGRFIQWLEGQGSDIPKEIATHFGLNSRRAVRPSGGLAALAQAIVILNAMYDDFAELQVLDPVEMTRIRNPFVLFRHKVRRRRSAEVKQPTVSSHHTERMMSNGAFSALFKYAGHLEGLISADLAMLRARIMFLCYVALWERSSAIASLTWADFTRDTQGHWAMRRDRKSKGPVWAPAPVEIVTELIQWRSMVGLPYQVNPEELAKSVFWMGGRSAGHDGPLDERTARRVIKGYAQAAADHFRPADPQLAEELEAQNVNPRILRLTMAAKFVASGGNPMDARSILGQKTLSPVIENLIPFDKQQHIAAMGDSYLAMQGQS